ncbi:MAG: hydroxymethylpyrimidine/phosphomethylpyrimidine kinase [Acidobacteriota bacterium]
MNSPRFESYPDPILLSIAGLDPSAGAGIYLDLQVFQAFGFFGAAVPTALTAQNTRGVTAVRSAEAGMFTGQYDTLSTDLRLSGCKCGMFVGSALFPALKAVLEDFEHKPVVIDPVFRSGSGTVFLEDTSITAYIRSIKGKGSLFTPNLDEVCALTGMTVSSPNDLQAAARAVSERVEMPCLVKGGHLKGNKADIFYDGQNWSSFDHPSIDKEVHGTGCFLSSALLCYLVSGETPLHACTLAIRSTQRAIHSARAVGGGRSVIVPTPSLFQASPAR